MGVRGLRAICGAVAGAAVLVVSLSGCTAAASNPSVASGAVAIGEQAISPSSSSSPTGSDSPPTCPDSLRQGLLAGLPTSDTLATLDVSTTLGVPSDPQATAGFTPACAFAITVSGKTVDELYFLRMSDSAENLIVSRIESAGFAPSAISTVTDGTQQIFASSTARIVVGKLTVDGISVLVLAG